MNEWEQILCGRNKGWAFSLLWTYIIEIEGSFEIEGKILKRAWLVCGLCLYLFRRSSCKLSHSPFYQPLFTAIRFSCSLTCTEAGECGCNEWNFWSSAPNAVSYHHCCITVVVQWDSEAALCVYSTLWEKAVLVNFSFLIHTLKRVDCMCYPFLIFGYLSFCSNPESLPTSVSCSLIDISNTEEPTVHFWTKWKIRWTLIFTEIHCELQTVTSIVIIDFVRWTAGEDLLKYRSLSGQNVCCQ